MEQLKFLGRGGAFFTEEGNTSAYFIEGKTLFLIDCGETVFSKIQQTRLLDENQIEEIYCFITHLHSDHIGSLSTLIYFCSYGYEDRQIKFYLVCPDELWFDLSALLNTQGVGGLFEAPLPEYLSGKFQSFKNANFIPTTHQDDYPAVSIEFETNNGYVFYSGDTNELDLVQNYVKLAPDLVERMYVEATTKTGPNNIHMSLDDLDKIVPREMRDKVFLMHFNNSECIDRAQKLGFQVVENVTTK